MKKRMIPALLFVALAFSVFSGCRESAYKDYPTYSHLNIDGYLINEHYGNDQDFREFYDRTKKDDVPVAVRIEMPDLDARIDDAELAAYLWQRFSLLVVKTEGQKMEGSEYAVTFVLKDGTQWTYLFHDNGEDVFFMENEKTGHRVNIPDQSFWPLIDLIYRYVEDGTWEKIPEKEIERPITETGFDWDADGDGIPEHFEVDYKEHRDGISGNLSIYMEKDGKIYYTGTETSSELTNRREGVDEEGPWIRFDYIRRYQMEEYTMEDDMVLEIRFKDGELILDQDYK